jgi:hypothetical protein
MQTEERTDTQGNANRRIFATFSCERTSQGNGPVCQVETLPEIMRVYRAYLVMTVKILAADTRCKGAKKLPKFKLFVPTSGNFFCTLAPRVGS